MASTNISLNEGLISIPPKMEEQIMFLLKYHVLWWAKSRLKGKTKQFPELTAALKKEIVDFGEDIPSTPYNLPKQFSVNSIPVSTEGMPRQYLNLQPTDDKVYFVIDWRPGSRAHGGWRPDKKMLVVYPMSFNWMDRYPATSSHADDLSIFMNTMEETIRHELRHMVQFVIIGNKAQTKQKPGYEKHGSDYFTSPVEHDPTIGSAINEFMFDWKMASETKTPDLGKAVRRFVGIIDTGKFGMGYFQTSKFFRYMKKSNPVRYKKTVKKFLEELKRRMDVDTSAR